MKIKDFIANTGPGPVGSFAGSILPDVYNKIRSDFREVARAKKAGSSVPGPTAMVQHVKDEYNVKMHRSTARLWLEYAQDQVNGTVPIEVTSGKNK